MIVIAPYDPRWPADFAAEAGSLQLALGRAALRIEHVGSTSVPGLAAKPVIDIQVSVASLNPLAPLASVLADLGYVHVPQGAFDLVYPFFQKPAGWPSTHHLHLCVAGAEQERKHLTFRDHLRRHPESAKAYAELKRRLAATHHGDTLESREQYTLSKSAFISAVLAKSSP